MVSYDIESELEYFKTDISEKNQLPIQSVYTQISANYEKSFFSDFSSNVRIDDFKVGTGHFYVLINGQYFDNIGLGESANIPTEFQIARHREFYSLVRQIMD